MTYAEAMFPAASWAGPFRLVPLTLGHWLLLERIASPFVEEGTRRPALRGDVAMAIWVCSRPWRNALRTMRSWQSRLARYWIAGRISNAVPILSESVALYLAEHRSGPNVESLQSGRSGPACGAPLTAALKATLMSELGLSEDEALDRPLAASFWDLMVIGERQGSLRILPADGRRQLSAKDAELLAFAQRVMEENRAQQEGATGA